MLTLSPGNTVSESKRNELGQFLAKSGEVRQVRSLRATDRTWERLNQYADSLGKSVADVVEDWVKSLPSPAVPDEPLLMRLWSCWHDIAVKECPDNIYGHPVRLKWLCMCLVMEWDTFVVQLAEMAKIEPAIELIPLRGGNHKVGDRNVAALTFHSNPFSPQVTVHPVEPR